MTDRFSLEVTADDAVGALLHYAVAKDLSLSAAIVGALEHVDGWLVEHYEDIAEDQAAAARMADAVLSEVALAIERRVADGRW